MCIGLALNLQQYMKDNGKALLITNRTKEKLEVKKLLEAGASWVETPAGRVTAFFKPSSFTIIPVAILTGLIESKQNKNRA